MYLSSGDFLVLCSNQCSDHGSFKQTHSQVPLINHHGNSVHGYDKGCCDELIRPPSVSACFCNTSATSALTHQHTDTYYIYSYYYW